jgi:hypothetical protein
MFIRLKFIDTLLYCKGHFILLLLIETTKDSTNLIGEEQKSVHLAFILEPIVEGQYPPKRLHGNTFYELWH